MNRNITVLSLTMILVLCTVSLYTAAPQVFAGTGSATPCNIQLGSCMSRTPDGIMIEFDVQPKPVTSMSEMTFTVRLTRNNTPVRNAQVEVDLTMPGMFMGTSRPKLDHVENGRYEGRGMFMRCASGRKTWQADVMVVEGAQRSITGFVFELQ